MVDVELQLMLADDMLAVVPLRLELGARSKRASARIVTHGPTEVTQDALAAERAGGRIRDALSRNWRGGGDQERQDD